ncbi:MAG: tetratricopeptide repeat protein [Nitrospira sp.]|nr:tetratricopeptide repeat protein [Nitrospira sp.]
MPWGSVAESAEPVPLFTDLGSLRHPITTTSEQAQRYFDQGLRLVYAFNHEEAIRSFEAASRLDPSAAMAYWGIALALGPNINGAMAKADERRAWDALQKARAQASRVSPAEQRYIDALGKRYSAKGGSRGALDKAYAAAMRTVWQQSPDDPDAGVLFAEALMDVRPWDFWTSDGRPHAGTDDMVATLEAVLAKHPDHPGACHYYIHVVEASPKPERALACAERLPGLMPGAGHLVHMPAHIYFRLGQYHEAAEGNARAVHVDKAYLAGRALNGDYADGYFTHNLHFLWASLMMEGRQAEALKTARELTGTITEAEARKEKWKEFYLPAPLFSMIRFGRWEDLLREPVPPKGLRMHEGMWRLGRGLASAAVGRIPGAEGEHFVLAGLAKQFRRDRNPEGKVERTMLKIAERLLAGDIAVRRQKFDEAIKILREGVALEESLPYTEPPYWPIPLRHYLGAALLTAGRPSEAEQVYREDLRRHPQNGWSLWGLTQSLRAQHKGGEADKADEQFKSAWTSADVSLTASRF